MSRFQRPRGAGRGSIAPACVSACAEHFLRPTIELIEPKLVVTLGAPALSAVNEAFDLSPRGRLPDQGELPRPVRLFRFTWLVPVWHPTASRLNPDADWREIGRALESLRRNPTSHPWIFGVDDTDEGPRSPVEEIEDPVDGRVDQVDVGDVDLFFLVDVGFDPPEFWAVLGEVCGKLIVPLDDALEFTGVEPLAPASRAGLDVPPVRRVR